MNNFSLENKTILISGASSGIGAQTAITLSQAGAKLILTARNTERLENVFNQLDGDKHQFITADLTQAEDFEKLLNKVPALDGIVHSAGMVRPFPVKFIGEKQIDQMFGVNYKATILLTSRLFKAKKINKQASLVFMSSISSHFAHKGGALYSGSKAAVNAYSKTIALEYAPQKIRSNVISAAMVKTPIFDEAEKAVSKEMMDKHGEHYPLGFGKPEDVANAILFLLSNAAKWITGTELVMDGGLTAGH
ncbi:SDR family NAD(P)-dependent oxidoreductase [Haloflavibacter putidus]|uniref:SDR family oxidoreductase n=1 Tax=Haloflavibacter putidus TaxID=2576776 RepID=A0A507ZJS4_9FLAO|nr:SDR family oxidoreductase [Haloflavibacter putidus]TQD37710.1 SDR family oxidoreductase [Haloflavibacter putidus]